MTTPSGSTPSPKKLGLRQREILLGQIVALSTVANEVKRELAGLPESSRTYGEPIERPLDDGLTLITGVTDVLHDATTLWKAANRLLYSIGHMPVAEDDPVKTPG